MARWACRPAQAVGQLNQTTGDLSKFVAEQQAKNAGWLTSDAGRTFLSVAQMVLTVLSILLSQYVAWEGIEQAQITRPPAVAPPVTLDQHGPADGPGPEGR